MPMMLGQIQDIFLKMRPGNEKEIREVFAMIGTRFSARKQEVFDEIAVLYAEKLSTDDLKQITAFFKTGVGAKFDRCAARADSAQHGHRAALGATHRSRDRGRSAPRAEKARRRPLTSPSQAVRIA